MKISERDCFFTDTSSEGAPSSGDSVVCISRSLISSEVLVAILTCDGYQIVLDAQILNILCGIDVFHSMTSSLSGVSVF